MKTFAYKWPAPTRLPKMMLGTAVKKGVRSNLIRGWHDRLVADVLTNAPNGYSGPEWGCHAEKGPPGRCYVGYLGAFVGANDCAR
jgi:hypothetical protein